MLKKLMAVVFLAICALIAPNLSYAKISVYQNGPFEVGFGLGFKRHSLESDSIPDSVKKEAENPTIISPYSGKLYGKEAIGTFDPNGGLNFMEGGMYLKYTPFQNFFVSPYFGIGLAGAFLNSTIDGKYGRGYTYERLLGASGIDYIRYIYGMEYEYADIFVPEIGLRFGEEDSFSILAGVSFQKLKVAYFKGIESYGKPGYLQEIGSSKHQLLNYKLGFKWIKDDLSLILEPSFTKGNGISGYGTTFFMFYKF